MLGRNDFGHHLLDRFHLIVVHDVSHSRIKTKLNHRVDYVEASPGLSHTLDGNVKISIAASEKTRCAIEGSGIITRSAIRSDESAAQSGDSSIASRMSRRILEGETRSLRKSEQHCFFRRDMSRADSFHQSIDRRESRRNSRLVTGNRRKE